MPKIDFRNKHFLALAGNGVLAVFGLGVVSLLYRFLPIRDVGGWFYFLTAISTFDAIRNGFLSTATVKFYAGADQRRAENVLGSVWMLASLITLVVLILNAVAFLFIGHIHNHEIVVTIKWLGLTYLSSLPFTVIFWKLTADEDFEKILWMRMVNSGSMILSFVVLIALGKLCLETAILFNLITNALTSVVGIMWKLSQLQYLRYYSKACMKELTDFGKYSLATSFSSTLLKNADTFVINTFLGPAALAIYSLPCRLMEIVEIPLRSFVTTGMTTMAGAYNKGEIQHVTYIMKKYAGMLTVAFVPLILFTFVFADLAIYLLAGTKLMHTEAAMIYRLFMLFAILAPIDRFNGITLDIIHKPNLNFYKVLVMLAANIVFDLIGVYLFPNVYGIAIGVFFTVFSGVVFGYYHLRKYISYTIVGILTSGIAETKALLFSLLKKNKA